MKRYLFKIALLLLALAVGTCLARAQSPFVKTCCEQVLDCQKLQQATLARYDTLVGRYNALVADSKAFKALVDARHAQELNEANNRIKTLSISVQNQTDRANAAESRATLADDELAKWKPRTKAGLVLRKVRNGLAIVGGVFIVGGVLRLTVF